MPANPGVALRVEEILGISRGNPGTGWSNLKLVVETDEFAVVRVTFLVSVDEVAELVQLMRPITPQESE